MARCHIPKSYPPFSLVAVRQSFFELGGGEVGGGHEVHPIAVAAKLPQEVRDVALDLVVSVVMRVDGDAFHAI
jgi:hypothetical protein